MSFELTVAICFTILASLPWLVMAVCCLKTTWKVWLDQALAEIDAWSDRQNVGTLFLSAVIAVLTLLLNNL